IGGYGYDVPEGRRDGVVLLTDYLRIQTQSFVPVLSLLFGDYHDVCLIIRSWRYGVPGDIEILEIKDLRTLIWSSWRYGVPGDSRPQNMVALPRSSIVCNGGKVSEIGLVHQFSKPDDNSIVCNGGKVSEIGLVHQFSKPDDKCGKYGN
nr:hypothetical protein [Tanacetum cinerariifolium]